MIVSFNNKRVVVMGLGRFGGGIGAARWLCGEDARVFVTDIATAADLESSLAALSDLDIEYHLGGHRQSDLDRCDLLVVSPAVDKRQSDFFQEAVRRGIPWTSEMNLFLERCPGRMVGVTGTVGKSTTTAMIGAALEAAGAASGWRHRRVWLGGNIGQSLLADLPSMTAEDVVVLELSSFQLEDASILRRSPQVAVITNFRGHHLDRHGTTEAYAEAKGNIYRYQARHHWLAMPLGDGEDLLPGGWEDKPRLYRYGIGPDTQRVILRFRNNSEDSQETINIKLRIPGLHNTCNAAAALSAARMLGVADTVTLPALERFEGLPHRLEFVRELRAVRYYNDSKATSPEATMTSMRAFDVPVVILVGGSDKGVSFSELGRFLADRAKAVICTGQSGCKISSEIAGVCKNSLMPVVKEIADFRDAVLCARGLAERGDVVLLSPGCASYDCFHNYEERGALFKQIALSWER